MDKEKEVNANNLDEFLKELNKMLDEFSDQDDDKVFVSMPKDAQDKEEDEYFERVSQINKQIIQERSNLSEELLKQTPEQLKQYEQKQAQVMEQVADMIGQPTTVIGSEEEV